MTSYQEKITEALFNPEATESYGSGEKKKDHLLEQYKTYLGSAEQISNRRQTANSFFVSINTALLAFVGYMNSAEGNGAHYWLVALAGVAIAFMWYRLIRSYRDLNTAKFKVVHQIEKSLPLSPYDAEWEAVGRGKNSALYLPFTHIEVGVPWVFLILHAFAFVQSFPWEEASRCFAS